MKKFYGRLNCSFGNEDWLTESKALNIKPGNKVLCITASGDRPLHLLLDPCSTLVAIDANPIQNYLLHLKRTAMEQLNTENYLAFLGANPSSSRFATFNSLAPHMDEEAALYWTQNRKMIDKGVLFQGALEKRIKLGKVAFFFRRREIAQLFACKTVAEQREFLHKNWSHPYWKAIFKWTLKPFFTQDSALSAYFEKGIEPGIYIYERMINGLQNCLASESALASFILKQKIDKKVYPPYLDPEGIEKIRPNLNRLTTINEPALNYLAEVPEQSFDRFSLSDISSYLNRKNFEKLMGSVYRAARPGARFCIRQLMTRYTIPGDLSPHFVRDEDFEAKLESEDRSFVYHYIVGTILKT